MRVSIMTRRVFLRAGLIAGAFALAGIRTASVAVAGVMGLKTSMEKRVRAVYGADRLSAIRAPQDNPQVAALYEDYLGAPGSHRAHDYLHMRFTDRSANLANLRAEGKLDNPGAEKFTQDTYPHEWFTFPGNVD